MGICGSKKLVFVPNDQLEGQDEMIYEITPIMEMEDEELDIFYTVFQEIDVHKCGNIQASDIFTFMNSDFTKFEQSVFQIFDADRSGKFNFFEFVCCLWNLLTIPENQLGAIVYLMKDPSGVLRVRFNDLKDAFDVVHKRKLEGSHTMQTIFNDLRDHYNPELSIQDVVKWSSKVGNNNIITPLLLLQIKLRKFVVGEKYWVKKSEQRVKHPEKSQIEYIKDFQSIVKKKLVDFQRRKALDVAEQKLKNRNRMGKAQANVARKQSILLDVFKLKKTSPAAAGSPGRVVPTAGENKTSSSEDMTSDGNSQGRRGKLYGGSGDGNDSPTNKKASKSNLRASSDLSAANGASEKSPSRKKGNSSSKLSPSRSNTSHMSASNLNDEEGELSPNKSRRIKKTGSAK